MPKPNTPDFEKILDWLEGRLPADEAATVARYVESAGPEVRSEVDWLREFREVSADTVFATPPPEVRETLTHRFESYARSAREPGLLERLLASLTFDSGLQPALSGVRSAGAQETQQQLVYATDLADVAINIQRRQNRRLYLSGQIFPTGDVEPEGFIVQLLRGSKEVGIAAADDLGEFAFRELEPGTYELVLSNEEYEILIPPIEAQA
jgi:hypothetical protein